MRLLAINGRYKEQRERMNKSIDSLEDEKDLDLNNSLRHNQSLGNEESKANQINI